MRIRRAIKWTLLLLLTAIAITAVVLYGLASKPPAAYQITVLTPDQKKEEASDFYRRIQNFGNAVQARRDEPFEWIITQDELNDTLASLDAILEKAQEGKGADVRKAMEKAGVADPAVAMDGGVMTLMVRSRTYDMVVSADIKVACDGDKLRIEVVGSRVGRMPIPLSAARSFLGGLSSRAGGRAVESGPAPPRTAGVSQEDLSSVVAAVLSGGVSQEDLSSVLAAVLSGIDGQPIDAEFVWPVNHVRVRIEGISIEKGQMKFTVRATRR